MCALCGQGAAKRQSIRMSWMRTAKRNYKKQIDAHFFISQPPTKAQLLTNLPQIRKEVAMYGDIIILPGPVSIASSLESGNHGRQ